MLTLFRSVQLIHDWGSSWEGLTKTRPALLLHAGALREVGSEEPRTRGFRILTGGGTFDTYFASLHTREQYFGNATSKYCKLWN